MQKTDSLWMAAFGLGFLFAFAVLNATPGIGLFLGVNALVFALWYFGHRNIEAKELKRTAESEVLFYVLTSFYVLLTFPYLYRLDYSIVGVLVGFHTLFLVFGALYFALPGALHLLDILSIVISPIAFGLNWLIESIKSIFELFKDNANMVRFLLKVVLYAAGSLLVFILFANLLSVADPEFKVRIDRILESLDLIVVMQRTVIAVIASFVSAGLLSIIGTGKVLPLFGLSLERAKQLWDKTFSVSLSKRSDAVLPIIITTPILFLFGLYVWVQFSYLFGHDVAAILSKYSFADYARRGFAELLVVGVLTYPLLSWSMNQSKSEWKVPRFATFLINTGIVSLLVIMLYSLITRMNLYVAVYGPSLLRSYVIVGAIFVGIALLAYEVLSVMKAAKPGYAIFQGRFMNDYVIVALLSSLGLLGVITLYPWSTRVVSQLAAQYETNGKVDVFQFVGLSLEAKGAVFRFGKTLEADGLKEAGLLLQSHAAQEVENYRKQRDDSIFASLFGYNVAQVSLLRTVSSNKAIDLISKFDDAMDARAKDISESYMTALETNNFVFARSLFDPEMNDNNIASFADGVSIKKSVVMVSSIGSSSIASMMLTESKSGYASLPFVITRNGKPNATDSALNVNVGFRNGKVVLLDSTLILSYLPDAVSEKNDRYDIAGYGYQTFCAIPTLDMIYSSNGGCIVNGVTSGRMEPELLTKPIIERYPGDVYRMGEFLKSDFVTKTE